MSKIKKKKKAHQATLRSESAVHLSGHLMPLANWHVRAAPGMIFFFYSTDLTAPVIFLYTSVHITKSPLPSLILIGSLAVPSEGHEKSEWKLKAHLPTERHWDNLWIYNNLCFLIMLPGLTREASKS